ncbi:hypothetical protein Fcan01_11369 [Folsomia candida]|uniref:DUF4806 domain-containing protein n=1 Tax=Folsomia candida TaxID=158441 RepID=A0A226E937_FOLCA|nr:hypothetical protein Fcan01_11369 [Folsomia candida]
MLRQLLKIQRSQVDILDQLTRSGANFQNSNPIDYSTPPTFPLDSIVEIRGFEVFLQTETDFDLAVSNLALIGRLTITEVVRKILRRILSPSFACQVSYSGKGSNKLAFKDFPQVHRLVFETVRNHTKFNE